MASYQWECPPICLVLQANQRAIYEQSSGKVTIKAASVCFAYPGARLAIPSRIPMKMNAMLTLAPPRRLGPRSVERLSLCSGSANLSHCEIIHS